MITTLKISNKYAIIEYFQVPVDNMETPDEEGKVFHKLYVSSIRLTWNPELNTDYDNKEWMKLLSKDIFDIYQEIQRIQNTPTFKDWGH